MLLALFITRVERIRRNARGVFINQTSARGSATFRARTSKTRIYRRYCSWIRLFPHCVSRLPGRTEACTYSLRACVKYSDYSPTIIRPERDPTIAEASAHRNSSNFRDYEPRCGNAIILKGDSDFANATDSTDARAVMSGSSPASFTYLTGR